MIDFKTSGSLDIATGSSQLPDNGLQRAKNVNLGTRGHITLRRGSFKLSDDYAFDTVDFIIEQGGDRYMFDTDGRIYRNELSISVAYEDLFDSNSLQLYDSGEVKLLAIR
jgi:hypothetical protein